MTRWAFVRNGYVLSVFEGDDDPKRYPDIADLLVKVDDKVRDNMVAQQDGSYAYPAPPEPSTADTAIEKLAALEPEQLDKLIALAKAP